jgi:hypothetical protein
LKTNELFSRRQTSPWPRNPPRPLPNNRGDVQ